MPQEPAHRPIINELLGRLDRGDQAAFRQLHELMFDQLLRYGLRIHPCEAAVEDQIQELFLWLLEHRGRLGHIQNPEIYLLGALRNNLRRIGKDRTPSVPYPPAAGETGLDPATLAEAADLHRDKVEFIRAQLALLPQRRREVIYLRYIEGYGFSEIAEIMGISSQVARNYATRALATIRQRSGAYRKLIS